MKVRFLWIMVLVWIERSQGCIEMVDVTSSSARLYFDLEDKDPPHTRWTLKITSSSNNVVRDSPLSAPPASLTLNGLEAWTTYRIQVHRFLEYRIQSQVHHQDERVICEETFRTIPRLLKIDAAVLRYGSWNLYGTAQIDHYEKFSYYFQSGPPEGTLFTQIESYQPFRRLMGTMVTGKMRLFRNLPRIRFMLVSNSTLHPETYTSSPFTLPEMDIEW